MKTTMRRRCLAVTIHLFASVGAWGAAADDELPLDPLPAAPIEVTTAAATFNRGDIAGAIAVLDGFLRTHPEDVGALLLRSVTAEKANDLPGAVVFSGRAIAAQRTTNPGAHADPGMMLRHQGLFDQLVAANPAPRLVPAQEMAKPPVAASASTPLSMVVPNAGKSPADTQPTAQWAISARASSEYRTTDYSAMQATGAPNVVRHGDNAKAWAAKAPDAGEEWIELTYAQAVGATGVRVVQSFNPGAIIRIEVIDAAGVATVVWQGPDLTAYTKSEIGTLAVNFPATATAVARVRIVLNEKAVSGWNEIDAVQLVGVLHLTSPLIGASVF
jgi:hypothetical protein